MERKGASHIAFNEYDKPPAKASHIMMIMNGTAGIRYKLQRLCEVYHNLPHKAWDSVPQVRDR